MSTEEKLDHLKALVERLLELSERNDRAHIQIHEGISKAFDQIEDLKKDVANSKDGGTF
ncbi:hypothetical protein IC232_18385 [Microvirga sp. BT688]|uniref:hypothetical protein n=1 Tax=Microvirga sp. TaxID=1873136 RepID=UPI0016855195|nr:hypothetical protein [Microvirga sp.]MBD2748665.1 hypothetical protein [Microvirga sp.]